MKSKLTRVLLLTIVMITLLGTIVSYAVVPYTTYTYSVSGFMQMSPHAYDPLTVISSSSIKKGLDDKVNEQATLKYGEDWADIQALNDVFVDNLGHVYLVDSGSAAVPGRIIGLDQDYNLRLVIGSFINHMGVPDSLSSPSGVFVSDTEILVADTEKSRIVIFDKIGNFVCIVPEPASDVFPEASIYKPVAVATDSAGRIYVVSKTTTYGVISLNRDGTFNSFIGPQKVSYNAWQMFWRIFQTAEQKAASIKMVPTEYNNLTIDSDGFLYVTTSSINAGDQQAAINARDKSDKYAPVKKLNPSGSDVMSRNGFFPPSGEVDIRKGASSTFTTYGPSTIVDVALGPVGTWSIIDKKRSRVFTYDSDGNLLFAFGDMGDQVGTIQNLVAINYQGSNMLLVDSTTNSVTVYSRTAYGDLLAAALQNTEDQNYSKAVDYYVSILQHNNNYDAAYIGIADSLYRDGEYNSAMQYYKYAYDTEDYSKAYSAYRKQWVEKWVLLIPVLVVVVFILISMFMKYANKVNKAGNIYKEKRTLKEEVLYAFYIIFHPFDGFWDLKHEKRGGVRGATLILAVTVLVFMYQSVGRGYLYNPTSNSINYFMEISSVVLPLFLYVIANWCLTTLFDGEGTFKDIYIASCYALTPLPILILPTVWLSNIVTVDEMSLLALVSSIAFAWLGLLIFFGTMVTHDFTLGKNIITTLATVVGACFIMFIGILFSSLLSKVFTFGYNIYVELAFRWA